MIWLNHALNVVVTVMLAANAVFLLLLLLFRAKWKAAGRMDKTFIDSYSGWKRHALLSAKVLLTAGVIWEAVMVLACAALLIFRPWNAFLISI